MSITCCCHDKTSLNKPVSTLLVMIHDDVIKWNHFPRYWPFVRGMIRSPVNFPHKGQRHGALIISLICARINGWVNNDEAGDLRRHCAHNDVTVMQMWFIRGKCQACYIFNSTIQFLTMQPWFTQNITYAAVMKLIWYLALKPLTIQQRRPRFLESYLLICSEPPWLLHVWNSLVTVNKEVTVTIFSCGDISQTHKARFTQNEISLSSFQGHMCLWCKVCDYMFTIN